MCRAFGGDSDGDTLCDEGGPEFCTGGATENCKDNCPAIANNEQIDTDFDGTNWPDAAPANSHFDLGTLED